jgi:hypothetical protein
MKEFFSKNWFNLLTVIIAIVAIFISLRGNEVALSASTPKIRIINDYGDYGIVVVWGCFNKNNTNSYQIHRYASEALTFLNQGGRTASLIKASFSEGSGKRLTLPLDIDAGTGKM